MNKEKVRSLLDKIEYEGGIQQAMDYGINEQDFIDAGLPDIGKEWRAVEVHLAALESTLSALDEETEDE